MEETFSKLKIYSLGIVAKNKALDSHKIEVTPIEDLNMVDGEITDHGIEQTSKGIDKSGATYETKVSSSNTIEATWMPLGSPNRHSAPDVRRGEYVVIYQFGDADKYYWVTFKDDLTLRKLETVIYAFSGTPDESKGLSAETHYFLEISTHKKLIHFHSSKANGEPFVYDVQINTGEGFILIQDDIGNFFTIDSKERRIELKNTDATHLDIDKRNYTLTVPDNTTIKTGGNTKIETGGNTTIETGGSTKIATKGSTSITSNGTMDIKSTGSLSISSTAGTAKMDCSGSMSFTAPSVEMDTVLTVSKIITPSEIDCPSISGVASGLK